MSTDFTSKNEALTDNNTIKAYAVKEAGGKLEPYEFDAGELGLDEVEIKVSHCGICHSDLSMIDNEWEQANTRLCPGMKSSEL